MIVMVANLESRTTRQFGLWQLFSAAVLVAALTPISIRAVMGGWPLKFATGAWYGFLHIAQSVPWFLGLIQRLTDYRSAYPDVSAAFGFTLGLFVGFAVLVVFFTLLYQIGLAALNRRPR